MQKPYSVFNEHVHSGFEKMETPFNFYDLDLLRKTIEVTIQESSKYKYHVHYALKANANDRILGIIQKAGLGADCVSGNEVKKAVETGFAKDKIVFAGVGKSDTEINYALDAGIFCFNCESRQEIEVINELAGNKGLIAQIALRINPGVDAKTHHYITTGLEENKFGINAWEFDDLLDLIPTFKNIRLTGLHFHIGSQIRDLKPFRSLCLKVNAYYEKIKLKQIELTHLNLGGGLGIDYEEPEKNAIPDLKAYFELFNQFLDPMPELEIHFELGRSIVGQCGSLISKVLYIKNGVNTDFMILDAGMTELIRPALYQSYHKVERLGNSEADVQVLKRYDVVGPICESSDCFGKARMLPETRRGDLIVIRSTGAYGEVMASSYNLRDKAKAVYSDDLLS